MNSAISCTANPSMPPFKTVRVLIKGRVQGVFFRDWTVDNARQLGLNGWVRNRRDGSVEAVFSGEPTAVDEMVDKRCRVGPPEAMVTGLNSFPSDDDPGQGFQPNKQSMKMEGTFFHSRFQPAACGRSINSVVKVYTIEKATSFEASFIQFKHNDRT
ncbi:putative acylphosphatase [Dioscorea sansibarensis]